MDIVNFLGKVILTVPGETLEGADLVCANLEGANLAWANLRDANLEGAKIDDGNGKIYVLKG